MDLFSQFPESNNQILFLPRINDEKMGTENLEGDDDSDQKKVQKNIRFENIKKVNTLRKRNTFILIIVIILILLIKFTFDDFLRALSIQLIDNYAIKEKLTKTIIIFINKIISYFSFPFFSILYLKYPLQYSFTYTLSFIVTKYTHAILFLIYGVDRDKEKGIKNFFENGSEKPNIQLQLIFITFFGYWRLLKSKPRTKKESSKYKKISNITFCLSISATIFVFLEEIFVGICSINMCLMGLIIAIIIYTMIYERFCVQLMKGKFFVKSIAKNYFLFAFITFIQLLVAILLYHNYNGISDIFEVFDYNPWKDEYITQNTMNKIVLKKSLFIFLLLFIIMGIRNNYKFVMSKKNRNYYNIDDIVQFNKDEKKTLILKRNSLYCIPPIFIMLLMNYLQYAYKIPLSVYLIADIYLFAHFGIVFYGIGIKKSLKKHLDEGRELEDYQNLNYSDNKKIDDNIQSKKMSDVM